MRCPFKFNYQEFEGGKECDPECAWLVGVNIFKKGAGVSEHLVCAITLIGSTSECPRKPKNWKEPLI